MPSVTAAAGFRLLFALSRLVPAGYFALSALESRQRTLREADQHVVTTVRLLSEPMNKVLQMDNLALAQVDELVRGVSWDDIRQSTRLQTRLPQADGIPLIAPDGRPTASSFWSSAPPIDTWDRDFFITLRDHADVGVYVSRSYPGKVFPTVHFQVARSRAAPGGVFDGVIVLSALPSYVTEFYATFAGPEDMAIALLRRDGAVLARDPAGDATAAFPPDDRLIAAAMTSASGVVSLYSPWYRRLRLAGFSRVPDSDLVVTLRPVPRRRPGTLAQRSAAQCRLCSAGGQRGRVGAGDPGKRRGDRPAVHRHRHARRAEWMRPRGAGPVAAAGVADRAHIRIFRSAGGFEGHGDERSCPAAQALSPCDLAAGCP